MESLAFTIPLLPGKTAEWQRWNQELLGPRHDEYVASRRRLGMTAERAYLQHTPQGDVEVVYIEAENAPRVFQGMATSQDAFDVWFRERVKDLPVWTSLSLSRDRSLSAPSMG